MATNSSDDSSDLIFHYTTAAGLLGILNTHSIWLSDTRFLNDRSEVTYAAKLIYDHLSPIDAQLANRIKDCHLGLDLRVPLEDNPYIASFCKRDDLLSMWRTYGSGGFSIGFDRSCLERLLNRESRDWDSRTEDENHLLSDANFGLAGTIEDVIYAERYPSDCEFDVSIAPKTQSLSKSLARIKNPAFHEEQEVRIIAFGNSCMTRAQLRESGGSLILYRPLTFPFEAIRSITVGPGVNHSSNLTAVKQYFEEFPSPRGEWGHMEIHHSDIPFRA